MAVCINHPMKDAVTRCKRCGKPICQDCKVMTELGVFCSQACYEATKSFEEKISDKGRGVINWSNGAYYPDPLGQLYRLYGPAGFFQRNGYWINDEFNEQAKALFLKDPEKRKAGFARMLEIYENDPPGSFLHVLPMFYGKQKALNWQPTETAFMDFRAQGLGSK